MKKLNVSLSIIGLAFFALACGIDFGTQNPATTPTLAIQGAPTQVQAAANVPTSAPTVGRSLASPTVTNTQTFTPTVKPTPAVTPTVTNTPTVTPTVQVLKSCPHDADLGFPPNYKKDDFLILLRSLVPTSLDRSINLIVNGDAEGGSTPQVGAANSTVSGVPPQAGWSPNVYVHEYVSVNQYDGNGFAKSTVPGIPDDHGHNYFGGGPNTGYSYSSATQTIDLAKVCPDAIAAVDKGDAIFGLAGWLGGVGTEGDNAQVTAEFTLKNGLVFFPKATLGPVLPADRPAGTMFVRKLAFDYVPAGTRNIVVTMEFTRTSGSYNDGMVDDVGFSVFFDATQ